MTHNKCNTTVAKLNCVTLSHIVKISALFLNLNLCDKMIIKDNLIIGEHRENK